MIYKDLSLPQLCQNAEEMHSNIAVAFNSYWSSSEVIWTESEYYTAMSVANLMM